jgi:CheY-like chemotaxis protein
VNVRSGPDKTGRILVIDDDEIALQAMSDVLEGAGYTVHALVSPIGATQVIAAHGIVAAVIDLNMPVMRGDRFISLVRSWDRIRDLPIVLVSGEAPQVIKNAVAHLAGVAVVTKANMAKLLVPTLEHILAGQVRQERTPAMASDPSGKPSSPTPSTTSAPRTLAESARSAQSALRDFTLGRSKPKVLAEALTAVRIDAQQAHLTNTLELLALALELTGGLGSSTRLPPEGEASLNEVLSYLAGDLSKAKAFERSLALTIQRSKLVRARELLR